MSATRVNMSIALVTAFLALSTITIMACSNDAGPTPIGRIDSPLFAYEDNYWSKPQIPVCFDTVGYPNIEDWVKEAITDSWQRWLNLEFTGWETCTADFDYGIAVVFDDEFKTSCAGPNGDNAPSWCPAFGPDVDDVVVVEIDRTSVGSGWWRCDENDLDNEECIRTMSIHEFGHALAFDHEHNRSQYDEDDCPSYVRSTVDNETPVGDTELTDYDVDSIMNYCSVEETTYLTSLDIAGGVVAYGLQPALVVAVISMI